MTLTDGILEHLREGATEQEAREFREQVVEFLDGVVFHEGEPFFKHLRRDLFSLSILPKGRIIETFDGYLDFQKKWNENTSGKLSYQLTHVYLYGPDWGTAVLNATYEDEDIEGVRFQKKLVIKDSFRKLEGIWFMVENSNTEVSEIKPFVS